MHQFYFVSRFRENIYNLRFRFSLHQMLPILYSIIFYYSREFYNRGYLKVMSQKILRPQINIWQDAHMINAIVVRQELYAEVILINVKMLLINVSFANVRFLIKPDELIKKVNRIRP